MKRFRHDLSFYRLSGFNLGELVPVGLVEVLPGDGFRCQTSMLARVAPLVVPVMHPVKLRIHAWYVPNRILWSGWEDFITGVSNSNVPTVTTPTGFGSSYGLCDHLGIPIGTSAGFVVNALPFRAYNMVFNEFYRDQDLTAEVNQDSTALQRVSWEKDYFTTARTQPARGGMVSVPVTLEGTPPAGITGAHFDIDQFRQGMAKMRFQEHRNRFGSRYTDLLRSYGVNPSDARLQRPEYLGGGQITISFSEVLATAPGKNPDGSNLFVGDLKGHGIGAIRTRHYRRFFEEHGFLLILASARPRHVLSTVLARHWGRSNRADYWQPEDEMLGDQPVYVRELNPNFGTAKEVFGWVPRHQDYRYHPDEIGGDFRRQTESGQWHMARDITAKPVLNASFVKCVPTNRPFADTAEPQLKVMTYHRIQARRLVSKVSRSMQGVS